MMNCAAKSSLNLSSDLNEKYTTKFYTGENLHRIIIFVSSLANEKSNSVLL